MRGDWTSLSDGELRLSRRGLLSATGGSLTFHGLALGQGATVEPNPGTESKSAGTSRPTRNQAASWDPPAYPTDPFVVGQFATNYLNPTTLGGWVPVTLRDEIRTLAGLHLDVLDQAPLAVFHEGEVAPDSDTSKLLSFSLQTGLPATAGMNTTIGRGQSDEFSELLSENDWTHPDGEPLETPFDALAETFDGENHVIEFQFTTNGIPSAFSPLGLERLARAADTRLGQGFAGFFVDYVFQFHGLDFSDWATAAFREHLDTLSADRLAELGIEQPMSFEIKPYMQNNELTPASDRDPRSDPVFREYVLHNHLGTKRYFLDFRSAVHDTFPDRVDDDAIALWGNQFMGSLFNPQAVNVYASGAFDVINTEHFPAVNPATDHVYKLLEAIGRFSKPVIAKATLTGPRDGEQYPALDPEQSYPMLQRFQVAEAYSAGARLKLPLTPRAPYSPDESITQWIREDGTVPEPLQEFIDFVWAHARFLQHTEPADSVVVIWSLPDRMYRRLPQWGIGESRRPGIETFLGTTSLLREAQIPYSVLVFGQPALWADAGQRDRLPDYDAVILPDVRSLTDAQLTTLTTFAEDGGTIIACGDPPSRTGRFAPRDDIEPLFSGDNTVVLSDNPGLQRERTGSSDGSLVRTLRERAVPTVSDTTDATPGVTRRSQPDFSRTIVHLLNYDYDASADSFATKQDVSLTLPMPDHTVNVARFYSPQAITDIELSQTDSSVQVTVPRLVEWGFLVLAQSETDLIAADAEQSARDETDRARARVSEARDAGHDWSPEFVLAETRLGEAETALEYGAYEQAEAASQNTIAWTDRTSTERPVVAFDLSHGQAESFDRSNPLEPLESNFDYPEYRTIDSWSDDVLAEVDVLFVPPALTYRGVQHNFTSAEVDQIEAFVADGGSLGLLARGSVAPDMDALTERFGYRFHGGGIMFPEETRHTTDLVNREHELTRGVPELDVGLGTPIAAHPDDATELATLSEDNDGWFHAEPPLEERNSGEESVPALPVYMVSRYGQGVVAVLGNTSYLFGPEGTFHYDAVTSNLLSFMTRQTAATSAGTTATASVTNPGATAERTADGATADGSPSGSAPGFGVAAAVAGIGGYALKRLLDNRSDE